MKKTKNTTMTIVQMAALALSPFIFISCESGGLSFSDLDDADTEEEMMDPEPQNPSEVDAPPANNPPINNNPDPDPDPDPNPNPNTVADAKEAEMANLIINSGLQQRAQINIDPILSQVARAKAEDLAARRYFAHTDPDGVGPNTLVTNAGYSLPGFYDSSLDGNNIESLAAGNVEAADTLDQWINSSGHKTHVFGEIDFFRQQTDIGVGYAQDPTAPFRFYWVFLSARH